MELKLTKIEDVYRLCAAANKCDGPVYVRQGHYCIDAKSLMGLWTIDWRQVAKIDCSRKDGEVIKEVLWDV